MKCQSLFPGKIRTILSMSSAEFAQRMVKVKIPHVHVNDIVCLFVQVE